MTRDLFADWGAFTLMGIAFSPFDGTTSFWDFISLHKEAAPPLVRAQATATLLDENVDDIIRDLTDGASKVEKTTANFAIGREALQVDAPDQRFNANVPGWA